MPMSETAKRGTCESAVELAARHKLDPDELLEAWSERAAIRQYLAGFSRRAAEVWAVGDVEAMYQIGLHCPETRRRMVAGGERMRRTQ
jgi:hypothetical protein